MRNRRARETEVEASVPSEHKSKETRKMSNLILRSWNNKSIRQRADGFISLTDMCSASGKLFGNWYQLKSTQEYLKVLVAKHYCDSNNGPIEVNVGGTPETTGTWGDRRVAFRMAQWISAEFALQVDEWVEELLLTGSVNIGDGSKAEPKTQALPPAMSLKDYMEVSAAFDLLNDPKGKWRYAGISVTSVLRGKRHEGIYSPCSVLVSRVMWSLIYFVTASLLILPAVLTK